VVEVRWVAAPLTFCAMHLGDVAASFLDQQPGVALEIMLNDRYVDLLAEGIDVAIRDRALARLQPCGPTPGAVPHGDCATPRFLARHGALSIVADLRRAPRPAFTEAASAGDWTLTDPSGQTHLIDGPVVTVATIPRCCSPPRAGAGVAYGPSLVFGKSRERQTWMSRWPPAR
jgi:DNA-binding transcriptional LysR family regulator